MKDVRQIEVMPDSDAVARRATEMFVQAAKEAIRDRDRFRVALSGGSTPRKTYELIASPEWSAKVQWDKVDFFWGDERYVPAEDKQSNYRLAWETMLSRLPLPPGNVHRVPTEISPPTAAAAAYDREVKASFGTEEPAFDFIFLGIGTNGHTASLFPHRPTLHDTSMRVVADNIPEVGMWRISMTAPLLNHGRVLLFIVTESDKAEVLREVLLGPADVERLPAQLIHPHSGRLVWLLDDAAASRIKDDVAA
jgi:6-phosphogluconolactonase